MRRSTSRRLREAVASTQRIETLHGHNGAIDGAIDGAIQVGKQAFCAKDVQPCSGVATRFVAIWHRTEEGWKITRLIRYSYAAKP